MTPNVDIQSNYDPVGEINELTFSNSLSECGRTAEMRAHGQSQGVLSRWLFGLVWAAPLATIHWRQCTGQLQHIQQQQPQHQYHKDGRVVGRPAFVHGKQCLTQLLFSVEAAQWKKKKNNNSNKKQQINMLVTMNMSRAMNNKSRFCLARHKSATP